MIGAQAARSTSKNRPMVRLESVAGEYGAEVLSTRRDMPTVRFSGRLAHI